MPPAAGDNEGEDRDVVQDKRKRNSRGLPAIVDNKITVNKKAKKSNKSEIFDFGKSDF